MLGAQTGTIIYGTSLAFPIIFWAGGSEDERLKDLL